MAAVIARLLAVASLAGCISQPDRPSRPDPAWTRRDDVTGLAPMFAPRMAFDSKNGQVILFAGTTNNVLGHNVYALVGATWTPICDVQGGPPPRLMPGFAYDRERDVIVVAGGLTAADATTPDDQVYECTRGSPDTWRTGTPLPAKIGGAPLVDASKPGQPAQLHLIGGLTANGASGGVLFYDPAQAAWNFEAGLPNAAASSGTIATYDEDHGSILAFPDTELALQGGGDTLFELRLGASSWSSICTTCAGFRRGGSTIVHVPVSDRTFLLNGFDPVRMTELAGAWELDNDVFVPFGVEPWRRDSVGAVYDPVRGVIVMYGGNGPDCDSHGFGAGTNPNFEDCGDTWELNP